MIRKFFRRLTKKLQMRIPEKVRIVLVGGVLRFAVFAFLAVVAYFLFGEMRQYVRGMEIFRLKSSDLTLIKAPEWITPDIKNALLAPRGLPPEFSLLDADISAKVASAYEMCPWVEEVSSVRKRYPNALDLKVKLRRPVSFVSYKGRFFLVDAKGVRLPGVYEKLPHPSFDLPCIKNAGGFLPEEGKPWRDEGVRAGAAVAKLILDLRREEESSAGEFPLKIAAIDVANIKGRLSRSASEIDLITDGGTRVHWGRSPLEWSPGELDPEVKLQNLLEAARSAPLASMEYLDIRFDPPVAKRRSIALR